MTEEQIVLVKNSWKVFRKIDAELIGDVFYSKLFLDNPELRKMFPSSMEPQPNGQYYNVWKAGWH